MNTKKKDGKAKTIFDNINDLTNKKTPWSEYNESDKKSFNVYMLNRWLSMDFELIDLVDYLQQYTINILDKASTYKVYLDLLPKKKIYNKYIGKAKGKGNDELLEILSKHFQISHAEAEDYLDIINKEEDGILYLIGVMKIYGMDDKEIKKIIKKI